jgi:hypothetical protein
MEKCAISTNILNGNLITSEINMDGYLNGVGIILISCYKMYTQVIGLIKKSGKIKRLDIDINKTEFDEGGVKTFKNLKEYYSYYNDKAYKYIYYFDGVYWYFVDFSYMKEFKRLTYQDIMVERDIYNKK